VFLARGVEDMNGLMAWQRLVKRYQPNTPLRRLQRLVDIISINKAGNASELGGMLEKWEMKVKHYISETGHDIDAKTKAAALLGMCPHDLRDTVVQTLQDPEDPHKPADAMRTYVNNRASSLTPSSKDIGQIEEHEYNDDYNDYNDDYNYYVGSLQFPMTCYNCNGKGHAAKACPSPKGKGKSGPHASQGKGKGEWREGAHRQEGWKGQGSFGKGSEACKGSGKGGNKGGGKGFAGECYRCGRYGHSIRDCRVKLAVVEEGGGEKVEEVGSIFEVCHITANPLQKPNFFDRVKVTLKNRF
jgi:hypothetical protein